jgi:hypothetical protein
MDALPTEIALAEEQRERLTPVYVSGQRLQEATRREDVVAAIEEIVANILGSEEVAVFVLDEASRALRLVGASGVDVRRLATVRLGQGIIGAAAERGERWVKGGGAPPARAAAYEAGLTACVPLRFGEKVTGAVAIFRLLPQKSSFEPGDEDVLALLETAAATALVLADRQAHPEGTA